MLLGLSGTAVLAGPPDVLGVRAGRQSEGVTRFVLDISHKVEYRVFTLPDPYRVVIDFPDMDWKIHKDALDRLVRDNPTIKGFRFGQFGQAGGRIVMEVSEPVSVKNSFMLNPVGPHPYRFVVDLAKTDHASFLRESDATKQVAAKPDPVLAKVPPPPTTVPQARKDTRKIIVIDPGHGGADAGVTGPGGTREKDYVLELARRLKTAVESRLGLRVLLTRDNDELVPIDRRTSLANNNKADLFVSLHANASKHSDTRGAQVLALNATLYQGRLEAARTPDLPVPVVTGGSRAIDMVPWDLAQMPYADASARVADVLIRRLTARKVPLFTVPTARLPLRPLVGANMPAVLIEVGFLSSPGDESALKSNELSTAIVEAIVDTISELRRDGSSTPPSPASTSTP